MSGDIGSGKSSVASALKEITGFDVIGTGAIQRDIAKRRGVTTLELNQISKTDRSIDDEIDSYVVEIGKTRNNLIIDSRLAWHFIPDAFKVFLAVDPVVGAERVFNASRADENNPSLAATLSNNSKRQMFEDERFQDLYQVQFRSYGNYDLVIDTSYTSPELIAEKINYCFKQWLKHIDCPNLWINPKKLLPTQAVNKVVNASDNALPDAMKNQGIPENQAIKVFTHAGFIYILDGHKRVMAAHKANIDLIPAIIYNARQAEQDGLDITGISEISPANIAAWEQALDFKYKLYPESVTPNF